MKKVLGIILAIISAIVFVYILVLASSIEVVLLSFGATALIMGILFLCIWLITSD